MTDEELKAYKEQQAPTEDVRKLLKVINKIAPMMNRGEISDVSSIVVKTIERLEGEE